MEEVTGHNNQLENVGDQKKVRALPPIFSNSFNEQNSHIIFELLLQNCRSINSKEGKRSGISYEEKVCG